MNELEEIIAELSTELHGDRIKLIAKRIEGLSSVQQFALIRSAFGVNTDKRLISRLETAWKQSQSEPKQVAAALRGAAATAQLLSRRSSVDLVWTGPDSGQVAIRHTEQVLLEVIRKASQRLFLVSFVAYRVPSVLDALKEALAREVKVLILMELSSDHGGRVDHDSIRMLRQQLPSAEFYAWQQPSGSGLTGAVHAKCAVADEAIAFITSANLTSAAMEKNMELGVLVQGGEVPRELHRHLEALIDSAVIAKVEI